MEENMSGIGFDRVIGQKLAVDHLQNALRSRHVSQAYLIHGEKGAGKEKLALSFAAALVCEKPQEKEGLLEPCGQCRTCRRVQSGSHPDVMLVTAERAGVTTKTKTLGVQLSRFVQADVAVKPYEAQRKIYIIPEAQRLTIQAQNALLKTLEEPPAYAVFLLLAENLSVFLPTILSRCVTIPLHPASKQQLTQYLQRQGQSTKKAAFYADLSHGNPGRCLSLCEEEMEKYLEETIRFLERIEDQNSHQIVVFAQKTAGGGKEELTRHTEDFLDFIRSWYRDVLVMKSTRDAGRLIFQEHIPYISNIAVQLPYESLEMIQQAIDTAQKRVQSKENEAQTVELLLLGIRRILKKR